MSVRAVFVLFCLTLLPQHAAAQGFAGLGTEVEGFAIPKPTRSLQFPQDHAPHPEYRIEWWYLTANLKGANGQDYGIQWTLFRSALAPGEGPGWDSPQIWMGHAGLTTPAAHFHAERLARGGIGQAGVSLGGAAPFEAWIDDWYMRSTASAGSDALSSLELSAKGADFSYDLTLDATGPLVLQGQNGFSVKSAGGQASYYYSQPFYAVLGTVKLPEGEIAVEGRAWLDREWSSQPLSETQEGWDWISLHLEDGTKLMGFRLRDQRAGAFTSATWISPNGTPTPYADGALTLTPLTTALVAGREVPVRWRAELPAQDLDLEIEALNPNSWMETQFPYWEGPVQIIGGPGGVGYLEMTGYLPE